MHEHQAQRHAGQLKDIVHELRHHIPFTIFGALTGVAIAVAFVHLRIPQGVSHALFATCHPAHVLLSAITTTAMYRLHAKRSVVATIVIGYVISVGMGTLSDSLIPYASERLLEIRDQSIHADVHIGFVKEWYLVNPMALLGIAIACLRPATKVSHAGHVLFSTWASLFHILMATSAGGSIHLETSLLIPAILFIAVWVPCCSGDIVLPLLFAGSYRIAPAHKDDST